MKIKKITETIGFGEPNITWETSGIESEEFVEYMKKITNKENWDQIPENLRMHKDGQIHKLYGVYNLCDTFEDETFELILKIIEIAKSKTSIITEEKTRILP